MKKAHATHLISTGAIVAGLLGGATAAAAQSPSAPADAPPPAAKAGGSPRLEEIIVTADRKNSYSADLVQAGSFRGAHALDTPLTVAVIPQEVIKAQQATQLLDALRNTAGVSSSQVTTVVYSNVAIRGILVGTTSSYRLDGALSIINQTDLPLEDKDRVEALKGASALYYGLTSPGGVINLTMKRPTQHELFDVQFFGNNHGGVGGAADYGNSWGRFGARVNAVYESVNYGIDNTHGTRTVLAGTFDYHATDNLTFKFDSEHIFKRVNEPGIFRYVKIPAATPANPYPAFPLPPLLDPHTNFGPDWAYNRSDETNLLATADWKISSAWDLTVNAGTSNWRRDRHFNTLDILNPQATPGTYLLTVNLQPDSRIVNKSLRAELAGTFETGPFVHEILVGVSENVRNTYQSSQTSASFAQSITDPVSLPVVPYAVPNYTNTQDIDIGYYAIDRVKFHDWLQLLGGVRKTDFKENALPNSRTAAGVVIPTGVNFHFKPTTYSGGVIVKPIKWLSVYGTYIQGLEQLQGAPVTAANAGYTPPPGLSTQKEAGIKVEPRRGLLFTAAWFDIKREQAILNVLNVYGKDGKAEYKGGEASLTGELTRDLSIYASGMILSARQISGAPSANICANAACTSKVFSVTTVGRRVDNTPKYTASVALDYKLTDVLKGLSVNAAMYYLGNRALNPQNNLIVPGYTTFSLGAGYQREIAGHKTNFRIYADNVTGKRYWASTGQNLLAEGAPRTIKFSISTSLF
jgi:iron complex outermembrane receptor protein